MNGFELPPNWAWWAAGAVGLLVLTSGKAQAAGASSGRGGVSNRDIDALTRMLITETDFRANQNEMAQIVNVAVNRARRNSLPLAEVVNPDRRAFPAWNNHSTYRNRFLNAHVNANWYDARAFVASVLNGAYGNIGSTGFVHPANPRFAFQTPCRNAPKWAPTSTPGWGTRCLPTWVHGGRRVGNALFS
jgi:hypothetical protein